MPTMSKVQKHSPRTSYHVSSASQCGAFDDASSYLASTATTLRNARLFLGF